MKYYIVWIKENNTILSEYYKSKINARSRTEKLKKLFPNTEIGYPNTEIGYYKSIINTTENVKEYAMELARKRFPHKLGAATNAEIVNFLIK